MKTCWYYTSPWYFRVIEPRVVAGETHRSIGEDLGIGHKELHRMCKKFGGTSPRRARLLLQIEKRKQQKEVAGQG